MRLTVWDLYSISICPLRWSIEGSFQREEDNLSRRAAKKVALLHSLGRTSAWKDELCKIWDEIFWQDHQDINTSVKATLALSKLQESSARKAITAYPSSLFKASIDAGTIVESSCDFVLLTSKGLEIWFFLRDSSVELHRTVIPGIESYIIHQSLREHHKVPIYLVQYYIKESRMSPVIQKPIEAIPDGKTLEFLSNQARRRIFFPRENQNCKDCKVNC